MNKIRIRDLQPDTELIHTTFGDDHLYQTCQYVDLERHRQKPKLANVLHQDKRICRECERTAHEKIQELIELSDGDLDYSDITLNKHGDPIVKESVMRDRMVNDAIKTVEGGTP